MKHGEIMLINKASSSDTESTDSFARNIVIPVLEIQKTNVVTKPKVNIESKSIQHSDKWGPGWGESNSNATTNVNKRNRDTAFGSNENIPRKKVAYKNKEEVKQRDHGRNTDQRWSPERQNTQRSPIRRFDYNDRIRRSRSPIISNINVRSNNSPIEARHPKEAIMQGRLDMITTIQQEAEVLGIMDNIIGLLLECKEEIVDPHIDTGMI